MSVLSTDTWRHPAPSPRGIWADLWRALTKDMFNAYHPEKHYMRGPGPKWRERHARGEVLDRRMIELDDFYKAR